MHILLIILLALAFAYSIALVFLNNGVVNDVNLLFGTLIPMPLGQLLVATIVLGVLIGILLALLLFRVFQNKWEIRRLRKEVSSVQAQLAEANVKLAQYAEKAKAQESVVAPMVNSVDPVQTNSTTL